ncbi:hypothetical protein LSAT2_015824 [Lamellibrachia satsuma]|nr:hypothetical protein LSAT2_015824 [Lamellibrachia satsuma]
MGQDNSLRNSRTTRGTPIVWETKVTKNKIIFACLVFVSPLLLYTGINVYGTYPAGVRQSFTGFLGRIFGVGPEERRTAVCSNSARLAFLHDACRSLNKDDKYKLTHMPDMYTHILSDDKNRMLFCDSPKTGSSLFKTLWLNYTRDVDGGRDIHTKDFLLKHGLRVLSAYREKLEGPNEYYRRVLGRGIEQHYGHVPANQSKGHLVTFEQFVHFLVKSDPVLYDHHWKPVTYLCHPCEVPYDYVVKLETSYVDYPHIFSKLKNITDSKRGFLESVASYKALTDFDRVKRYYARVPATHMTIIERTYRLDLNLFGYKWNNTSLSYGCQIKTEGKECC